MHDSHIRSSSSASSTSYYYDGEDDNHDNNDDDYYYHYHYYDYCDYYDYHDYDDLDDYYYSYLGSWNLAMGCVDMKPASSVYRFGVRRGFKGSEPLGFRFESV